MNGLAKILSIASNSIADHLMADADTYSLAEGKLANLLAQRNGFYAFESALHVLPMAGSGTLGRALAEWNSSDLWRSHYELNELTLTFFAEDLFGGQFGLSGQGFIYFLNPETGKISEFADDLIDWGDRLISDYNYITGYSIGHDWQISNGQLLPGHRLIPRVPFSCGGALSAGNMVAVEAAVAMRYWGDFSKKIADVADGEKFIFHPSDLERIRCAKWSGAEPRACHCLE